MITLCMIAKDEEGMIGDCLRSVQGLVDHMLVVDTGSTDRTVAIAQELGAQVIHHPWNDDFSAARNAALPHLEGDWLLVLDADEHLVPEAHQVIRDAIACDDFQCGMLPLYHASSLDASDGDVLSGRKCLGEPVRLARLLKRTDSLKWKGMFHENIGDWVLEEKRVVKNVDAAIIHFGNVPEHRMQREKEARNERMLRAYVEAEPDNLRALCNYLKVLVRTGDAAESRVIADRTWSLLQRQADQCEKLDIYAVIMCATLRAELLKKQGDIDESLQTLSLAEAWGARDPSLFLVRGVCLEQAGLLSGKLSKSRSLFELAIESYSTCLSYRNEITYLDNIPGVSSWAATLRLGHSHLRLMHWEEAINFFQQTLDFLSDVHQDHQKQAALDAAVGLVEALSQAGRFEQAQERARHLISALRSPDLWAMAADAAERAGQFKVCLSMMKRTASALKKDSFQTSIANLRYGELVTLVNLFQGHATAGPGAIGLLGALLSGRDALADIEVVWPMDILRLQRVVDFLTKEQPKLLAVGLEKASALTPLFSKFIISST